MALQKGTDYFFIPQATTGYDGATFVSVLATPEILYVFPKENITGAGFTATITTFKLGGNNIISALE